MWPKAERR